MQLWMWMWVLIVIGGVAILAGVGWSLHRFAIRLEDAGYLYYRKQSPTGGGGSVFGEVDKLDGDLRVISI